jgi:hypothetical protein
MLNYGYTHHYEKRVSRQTHINGSIFQTHFLLYPKFEIIDPWTLWQVSVTQFIKKAFIKNMKWHKLNNKQFSTIKYKSIFFRENIFSISWNVWKKLVDFNSTAKEKQCLFIYLKIMFFNWKYKHDFYHFCRGKWPIKWQGINSPF